MRREYQNSTNCIKGGYVVNPYEKLQRGCTYCLECECRTVESLKPLKHDYDDQFVWICERKEYDAMVEFNRMGYSSRTRKGIDMHGVCICPYKECPYHELDDVETYSEYEEMQGIRIGDLARLMSGYLEPNCIWMESL